jgi:hypothetical protein
MTVSNATHTVADWLDAVEPAPPPALMTRLRELLAPHAHRPLQEAAESCLAAGETQLAAMLSSQATDRGSALDLLAVDALVTYAFEAAADSPAMLERLANDAMTRIAEIPEAS